MVCEETKMISKLDVRVPAEGGIGLGAWLFLPKGDGAHPAITMAHGFAGTREHGLERFARAFATAGFRRACSRSSQFRDERWRSPRRRRSMGANQRLAPRDLLS